MLPCAVKTCPLRVRSDLFYITVLCLFVFSFLSSTGEGFEAFFTEKGHLVVGVCTKKEYVATSVTDLAFDDQEWV